jgi:hypothetical protein
MKTKIGIVVLLCLFGLFSYGCYHKGYSNAAAAYQAEYGTDWSNDPSVHHSASYTTGFARGHAAGSVETRQKDFSECGEELAKLVVETGDSKVAGKWMAEGYILPSQLEAAASQHKQKQP